MGLAGLWSEWLSPSGEKVLSFSVLTIRADGHPVFSRMNGPDHDKRMPVILPSHVQEPWLYGSLKEAEPLLRHCPAEQLQAVFHASLTKARYAPKSWESMPDMFASEWHVLASAQPHKPLARAPRVVPPQPPDRASPTTGELF